MRDIEVEHRRGFVHSEPGSSLQIVFWAGWKGETQREKMLTRHVWYNTAPSPGNCIHVWLGLKSYAPTVCEAFTKLDQGRQTVHISGFSPHAKKKAPQKIFKRHPIFKFLYPGWRQCQVSKAPQSYSATVSVRAKLQSLQPRLQLRHFWVVVLTLPGQDLKPTPF